MSVIKNLPTRLLRHIAKHPNSLIDGFFVNRKPANATEKRKSEINLLEALQHLHKCGFISLQPIKPESYCGELTYAGREKLDEPKKVMICSIATTVREIFVFSIGTAIGLILGSLGTLLLK
jgi:hypothetical protein